VRHVLEVVIAFLDAGSAAEVVEGNGGVASLGEAERELLVEPVEPAHVREDDHADVCVLVRRGGERSEPVSVRRLEDQILMRYRRARDLRDGRNRIEVETHAPRP